MTTHLSPITRDLPDTYDVQAADVSVFMQGKVTSVFPYTSIDGRTRSMNLHSFNESLIEPIAEALGNGMIVNRVHLHRVLQDSLQMGTH